MDLITHLLTIWNIGKLFNFNDGVIFVALIASTLPDIDGISILFGWSSLKKWHRGPTHSIFGGFLVLILGSAIIWGLNLLPWSLAFSAIAIGYFSHLGLDYLWPRPISYFWPFSKKRVVIYWMEQYRAFSFDGARYQLKEPKMKIIVIINMVFAGLNILGFFIL